MKLQCHMFDSRDVERDDDELFCRACGEYLGKVVARVDEDDPDEDILDLE